MTLRARLNRVLRDTLATDHHPRGAARRGMSGAPVGNWQTDDVATRLARAKLTTATRHAAAAQRLAHRGWDWNPNAIGPGFYGQTVQVPGDQIDGIRHRSDAHLDATTAAFNAARDAWSANLT